VYDGADVRTGAIDLGVQEALDERTPAASVAGFAVEREFEDVVTGNERWCQRPRHQESVGAVRVTHRHVTRGVEDALVREDAAGGSEVVEC
jgi:hypothetical protein